LQGRTLSTGSPTLAIMKQDACFFQGKDPILVYIAKRLNDALRLEDLLGACGVDYGVEADEYRSGVLFRSVRAGAFFYVLPDSVAAAHEVMRRNGYRPYAGPQGTAGPE
jgi:hypothetical protein